MAERSKGELETDLFGSNTAGVTSRASPSSASRKMPKSNRSTPSNIPFSAFHPPHAGDTLHKRVPNRIGDSEHGKSNGCDPDERSAEGQEDRKAGNHLHPFERPRSCEVGTP
ncbi:hypothetical protein EVG20_g2701 [Dentipellis fragilis]|uniref:Uncharacterized protein n=1 Tax=Dentipellis fragilis TaxID=205917 RepID=A0A4Y9Z6D4_9AGAM|nr:hypothetical protein EVG20_g2701 [Dentipellis fragilis]